MFRLATQRAVRASCAAVGVLLAVALTPQPASAERIGLSVQVDTSSSLSNLQPGEQFEVSVFADISRPILGFGFTIDFDSDKLNIVDSSVGSRFYRAKHPADDAFFSALAFPDPVSGDDVLLAKATFEATSNTGASALSLFTDSTLLMGFAELNVNNFATFSTPGAVTFAVGTTAPDVPEPGALALLALGGCWLLRRRR